MSLRVLASRVTGPACLSSVGGRRRAPEGRVISPTPRLPEHVAAGIGVLAAAEDVQSPTVAARNPPPRPSRCRREAAGESVDDHYPRDASGRQRTSPPLSRFAQRLNMKNKPDSRLR